MDGWQIANDVEMILNFRTGQLKWLSAEVFRSTFVSIYGRLEKAASFNGYTSVLITP